MSLEELAKALRDDFAGREELRLRLREEAPKFGNDDDRVDALARQIARHFCRTAFQGRQGDAWLPLTPDARGDAGCGTVVLEPGENLEARFSLHLEWL